jgi:hypothetical protein
VSGSGNESENRGGYGRRAGCGLGLCLPLVSVSFSFLLLLGQRECKQEERQGKLPLSPSTSSTRLGTSKALGNLPSNVDNLGWISAWRMEGVMRLFASWAIAFMLPHCQHPSSSILIPILCSPTTSLEKWRGKMPHTAAHHQP